MLKTVNINKIVQQKLLESILLTGLITTIWLASMTIGIFSIFKGQFIIALGYIIGSMLGCYTAIKYEQKRKGKNSL
jgi:positive regulator of sigma E activity